MTNSKPPADLTPAELIAELERQRHKADQDAQRRHHGTHYDYRMRGYYEGRQAALRDALALVRPVVERLAEELEREQRNTAAAYVLDRAAGFDPSDGTVTMLENIAEALRTGEHMAALRHGELDDILERPLFKLAKGDPDA